MWKSFRSEGYHRALFFHEHGQLPVLPSFEQYRAACRHARLWRVVRERAAPFARRLFSRQAVRRAPPQAADPTRVVAEATIYRFAEHSRPGDEPSAAAPATPLEGLSAVERVLCRLNEIDALRALMLHCAVPPVLVAGLGMRVPSTFIANHLLASPHPCEKAVWDFQLLQGDPGGLEQLESRVEEVRRSQSFRGRVLRTLGTRRLSGAHRFELVRRQDPATGEVRYVDAKTASPEDTVVLGDEDWSRWFDHVLETVARARRFDYFVREQKHPLQHYPAPTLIQFLRLAAMIEVRDYRFFEDRSILDPHPEIGWPPDALGT